MRYLTILLICLSVCFSLPVYNPYHWANKLEIKLNYFPLPFPFSNKSNLLQEEFEQFKKKFLHSTKEHSAAKGELESIMKRKIEEDIKQSRTQFSHGQQSKQPLPAAYNGVENSAKRLMTAPASLNDLNNNLIKNALTNSTNPASGKSLAEHKLLNGLLSKPLADRDG